MVTKKDKQKYLMSILLFLFGLGVGNLEKIFILGFFVIVFWNHTKYHNYLIKRRSQLIPLALWGFFFSIMFVLEGGDIAGNLVYYLVAPSIMCVYGHDLINDDSSESLESDFLWYVYIVSLGFFLHSVISVVLSAKGGIFQYNAEYIKDVWSGRMISRTIMGMYMVPSVCVSIPMFFRVEGKHQILQKVLAVIVVVSALITSIYVGNRALLIISGMLLIISFIVALRFTKKKIRLIGFAILFLIVVTCLFGSNVLKLEVLVGNSFLAKRSMDIKSDGRFEVYKLVIQNFDNYLLGWLSSGGYIEGTSLKWAHNVWVDVFIYGGVVPFLLFMNYSLRVMRDAVAVLKNKFLKTTTKVTVIALLIGIFLNWAVEPVLQSNPYFLSACCMIFGMYASLKLYRGDKKNVS